MPFEDGSLEIVETKEESNKIPGLDTMSQISDIMGETAETTEAIVDERFSKFLAMQLAELKRISKENIYHGPNYVLSTPIGKVRVAVVLWNSLGGEHVYQRTHPVDEKSWFNAENEQFKYKNYYFFAQNEKGKIVGCIKCRFIYFPRGNKRVDVETTIHTGLKGKGLAVPLHLAFIDLVQRMSNKLGKKITWIIQNENLFLLEEAHKSKMADLIKEQERWQAMFGNGGKFGIKMHNKYEGKKVFLPNKEDPSLPLAEIETIELMRMDESTTNLVYPSITRLTKKTSMENDSDFI